MAIHINRRVALYSLLAVGVALLASSLAYRSFLSSRKPIITLTKEQLEEYYSVYQVPQVIFLRKALNAYLSRDSKSICILNVAVTENMLPGILSGLDAFDKSYYRSKFIVTTINDNTTVPTAIGNDIKAKDIQIVFQDKPDRMFYALVGKEPEGNEMCLLGFNSKEPQDTEVLQKYNEAFRVYLSDKEHAL